MKTMRLVLAGYIALLAAGSGVAQTVSFVGINRSANTTQTTAGGTVLNGTDPYQMQVFINGSSLNLLSSFSFKKPGDAVTVYSGSQDGDEWRAPTTGGGFTSMANLNSAFPGGAYTISVSGFADSSLSIANLVGGTNDGLPDLPFIIGTQDGNPVTWSGGKMLIDPTKELTLTSSLFTTNFTAGLGRVGLGVFGPSVSFEKSNESPPPGSFVFSGNSVSHSFAANVTFTPGSTYSGDLEFNNILSPGTVDLSTPYGAGAVGVAIYSSFTSFQIQAIPEPSTYAAIFGGLALTGVMLHRRRKPQA